MFRKRKGQSTLEYVALFMVVVITVVVIIYGIIQPGVNAMLTAAGTKITTAVAGF